MDRRPANDHSERNRAVVATQTKFGGSGRLSESGLGGATVVRGIDGAVAGAVPVRCSRIC